MLVKNGFNGEHLLKVSSEKKYLKSTIVKSHQ